LTVSSPLPYEILNSTSVTVSWFSLGTAPTSYSISVDSQEISTPANNVFSITVDLSLFANGVHVLTVAAIGVTTPFALSTFEIDIPQFPQIPSQAAVTFTLNA